MVFTPFGGAGPLQPQAATPAAGFALQNGTPVLLSWTTPNDGRLHRVMVIADQVVTSAETGGGVNLSFTDPGGTPRNQGIFGAGLGAGFTAAGSNGPNMFTVGPGTVVSLGQSGALLAGAATVWAEVWGS